MGVFGGGFWGLWVGGVELVLCVVVGGVGGCGVGVVGGWGGCWVLCGCVVGGVGVGGVVVWLWYIYMGE